MKSNNFLKLLAIQFLCILIFSCNYSIVIKENGLVKKKVNVDINDTLPKTIIYNSIMVNYQSKNGRINGTIFDSTRKMGEFSNSRNVMIELDGKNYSIKPNFYFF